MQILAPEGTPAERHERPDGESQQGVDREQVVGGDRLADEVRYGQSSVARSVIGGVSNRARLNEPTAAVSFRPGSFGADENHLLAVDIHRGRAGNRLRHHAE